LQLLASRTAVRTYETGGLIFCESEACKGLHVVISGSVRIFKTSPGGREHVLALEQRGSSIAEIPVFDGGTYPASASAVGRTELLFISREDIRAFCMEHPEVALKLLQVVGGRLRRLVGIIEELSFTTVRHRLISWLLRQARLHGEPSAEGSSFAMTTSHQELASQIGTVRELVSRNLARLQAEGLMETENREIRIPSIQKMEAELSDTA
jgi:CRP/FNR family transcriptional regulator